MGRKPKAKIETVFYVYTLTDPRKEQVFYVGKGKEKRPFAHAAEARTDCDCRKCGRIRAAWDAGYDVRVDYVYETNIERDALLHEKQLIADIGLHRLCNLRPGQISTKVETWEHPGIVLEKRFEDYCLEQARLEAMKRELESGGSLKRNRGYWKKKIDAAAPIVSKPPPWLEKIK
jgi:hypothetical protein